MYPKYPFSTIRLIPCATKYSYILGMYVLPENSFLTLKDFQKQRQLGHLYRL